jgi:hypothetical protein
MNRAGRSPGTGRRKAVTDPISELAVGLNEDAKAARKTAAAKPKADPVTVGDDDAAEGNLAIDRMGAIVADSEFDAATLVGDIRDCMIDIIKSRPKPWIQLSNAEQHDVVRQVEYAAREMVAKAVDLVRADGKDAPIKAILESYAEKDGIKATLKIKTMGEDDSLAAVAALHSARGKMVLITKASADDYSGQRAEAMTDPDQPGLEFAPTSDVNDDDLAY